MIGIFLVVTYSLFKLGIALNLFKKLSRTLRRDIILMCAVVFSLAGCFVLSKIGTTKIVHIELCPKGMVVTNSCGCSAPEKTSNESPAK